MDLLTAARVFGPAWWRLWTEPLPAPCLLCRPGLRCEKHQPE